MLVWSAVHHSCIWWPPSRTTKLSYHEAIVHVCPLARTGKTTDARSTLPWRYSTLRLSRSEKNYDCLLTTPASNLPPKNSNMKLLLGTGAATRRATRRATRHQILPPTVNPPHGPKNTTWGQSSITSWVTTIMTYVTLGQQIQFQQSRFVELLVSLPALN